MHLACRIVLVIHVTTRPVAKGETENMGYGQVHLRGVASMLAATAIIGLAGAGCGGTSSSSSAPFGAAPSQSPRPGPTTGRVWIMSNEVYNAAIADPQTASALKGSTIYVHTISGVVSGPPQGVQVVPVMKFTSLAVMRGAIADAKIPSDVHVLAYDNEDWNRTPANERLDPANSYLQAAQLAHAHGYKFEATPGWIPGYAGVPTPGQGRRPSAADIDPAIASVTDLLDIQAQLPAWQHDPAAYVAWVKPIAQAAKNANPNLIVVSGLVARDGISASAILALAKASEPYVQGWWLNVDEPASANQVTANQFISQLAP